MCFIIFLLEKTYWMEDGLQHLKNMLRQEKEERQHVAKNVIIFIGDGMGTTTTTAARIYKGQRNFGKMGEEHSLSFERFPNVALVKVGNCEGLSLHRNSVFYVFWDIKR